MVWRCASYHRWQCHLLPLACIDRLECSYLKRNSKNTLRVKGYLDISSDTSKNISQTLGCTCKVWTTPTPQLLKIEIIVCILFKCLNLHISWNNIDDCEKNCKHSLDVKELNLLIKYEEANTSTNIVCH